MVPWPILCEHGLALLLVWATVSVAGCALLPFARARIGLVGAPLLGVVFWTVALYVFRFPGGLDLAAGLVGLLAAAALVRAVRARVWAPSWKRLSWSTAILVLGCLPYTTTLLYQFVPFGMDGSMHATAAAVIAGERGLPENCRPFEADVPMPPINLGLPTVAAVAIRWGGEPAAVLLACHHLTFTLLILATYLLLRRWVARTPAAVLAVVSVWAARAAQASLEWGGFPTVLSVAVGLFAARLVLEQSRSASWRLSALTGAAIVAIPLIHGVGGGTWLYCVGPWAALTCLLQARDRRQTARGLAITAVAAVVLLLVYRSAGSVSVQTDDLDWTHDWQISSAALDERWPAWFSAWDFIRRDSGSFIVLAGFAGCGVLVIRRQWRTASMLAAAWISLATVVANSRWWVLPASFLLYPERALYWAAPISAVTLALAWRALPPAIHTARRSLPWMSGALLLLAAYYQNQFYQKIVREDFVNQDGWQALMWARQHLRPERDFVEAMYNSTGSFLPAVAGIACTGSHHHHFIRRQVIEAYRHRTVTHVLLDRARAPGELAPVGKVVFHNRTISIIAIDNTRGAKNEAKSRARTKRPVAVDRLLRARLLWTKPVREEHTRSPASPLEQIRTWTPIPGTIPWDLPHEA